MKQSIFFFSVLATLLSVASIAQAIYPIGALEVGVATWYNANGYSGTCSLDTMPVKYIGTAMSSSQWFGANICGACLNVYGPNNKTTKVMVSNMCPNCGTNHLDLDPIAFTKLAPKKTGRLNNIKWKIVPCNYNRPVQYHFKIGSSRWWFALQVLYHNVPVVSMEISTNGGKKWTKVERLDYNYFVNNSGFGPGPYTVRITGENGQKLVDRGIKPGNNTVFNGKKNFS